MSDVTRLLEAAERGEPDAAEQLLNVVYAELHRMAEQKLSGDAGNRTFQPTALVHDAWLQLVGDGQPGFANRAHFFAAAAKAMRRILIDRARARRAEKRGGGVEHIDLDSVDVAVNANDTTLLRLDEALAKLAGLDPSAAEVVRLRFFVGLKNDEMAEVLKISERTARRHWIFARAWLYDELQGDGRGI
ncbi:MAG: RNA polymerase subunit sigma [Verrucomicrobia bacterium]|nr:MAG: RNA polymerase subunit sigma [Verrucomicrobiota bacterium]